MDCSISDVDTRLIFLWRKEMKFDVGLKWPTRLLPLLLVAIVGLIVQACHAQGSYGSHATRGVFRDGALFDGDGYILDGRADRAAQRNGVGYRVRGRRVGYGSAGSIGYGSAGSSGYGSAGSSGYSPPAPSAEEVALRELIQINQRLLQLAREQEQLESRLAQIKATLPAAREREVDKTADTKVLRDQFVMSALSHLKVRSAIAPGVDDPGGGEFLAGM